MPLSKSQKSLKKWTKQKWRTSDGSPSKGKKRYLPDAAWKALSIAERRATNKSKPVSYTHLTLPTNREV